MHGFYSFGTLAGAGVGMALTAFNVPANAHILLAALVAIVPIFIAIRAIPDGTGKNAADGAHTTGKRRTFLSRCPATVDRRGGTGNGLR